MSWLGRLKRTYIGNATATRDLRIQLRGSRAAILFTIYLVVMAFVLLMMYSSSVGDSGRYSLATAQSNLQGFYYATLGSLATVITLVAPSMGAFAIVTEKQRRSLDLVFSAPTEPKYYLVGKLISAYRYVWLLLVLSLPFCAVSVTLGGTTWNQLFITFLLYSFYGLVCVSFGLLLSTLCSKVLPAIIWTYAALGCYVFLTFLLVVPSAAGLSNPFDHVNPFSSLCPATFSFLADQTWPVFGKEVPTWILSILLHLLVVKFVILAAGSMLAPGNSKEIRGLRVHGLIYGAGLTYLVAFVTDPIFRSMLSYSTTLGRISGVQLLNIYHGKALFGILFLIGLMIVPYLASFGFNDLRRHRPDGFFNVKQVFSGRPSGHLPYLILVFLVCTIAYVLGVGSANTGTTFFAFGGGSGPGSTTIGASAMSPFALHFLMFVALAASIWALAFFIGWFVSGRTPVLSRGRTISLFFFVLGLILPTAMFAIIAPEDANTASGVWMFNPVASLFCAEKGAPIAGIHALALACICVILLVVTIPNVQKRIQQSAEDLIPKDIHDSHEKIPPL